MKILSNKRYAELIDKVVSLSQQLRTQESIVRCKQKAIDLLNAEKAELEDIRYHLEYRNKELTIIKDGLVLRVNDIKNLEELQKQVAELTDANRGLASSVAQLKRDNARKEKMIRELKKADKGGKQ